MKQVVDVVRSQGITQAYRAVMKKLDAWSPLGNSTAGEIIGVGSGVGVTVGVGDGVGVGSGVGVTVGVGDGVGVGSGVGVTVGVGDGVGCG